MTAPPSAGSCGIPHKTGGPKVFTNTTSSVQAASAPGGWCLPKATVKPRGSVGDYRRAPDSRLSMLQQGDCTVNNLNRILSKK